MSCGAKLRTFAPSLLLLLLGLIVWNHFNYSAPAVRPYITVQRPSLCRTASVFRCDHCIPEVSPSLSIKENESEISNEQWAFEADRDARNYRLTDAQCDVAFPGLFEDVNAFVEARKHNPITKGELSYAKLPKTTLHLLIYDNELYVINHPDPEIHKPRSEATLYALYRAILTSPTPLPNVEFTITVDDFSEDPNSLIWSYTRTADDKNTWLIPDFGFWSYGEPHTPAALGSWSQVRQRVLDIEDEYSSFSMKIPKAFWRGDAMMADDLRMDLLKRTYQLPWADVENLDLRWDEKSEIHQKALPIHEHCKYMFLIHTEGASYSGRLKYLQNCRSVIFAHTLEWIQPFEYLMVSSGPKQNYVEVSRDFYDLEEKVEYYLAHVDEAERVANNSVATFRDRYNTPAAETCYWRKLIRGWRQVSFEPEFYEEDSGSNNLLAAKVRRKWRGTPFENYIMRWQVDGMNVGTGMLS